MDGSRFVWVVCCGMFWLWGRKGNGPVNLSVWGVDRQRMKKQKMQKVSHGSCCQLCSVSWCFSCNPHGPSPTNQANAPASCFMRAEDVAIGTPVGVTPASRAAALTTQPGGSCGESMRFYEYLPLSSGEVLEWKARSDCLKMLIYIWFYTILYTRI